MNAKLTAAAVVLSTFFAGAALADPHSTRPAYVPPGAVQYTPPAYSRGPVYGPPEVTTVAYRDDDDRGRGRDRRQHEAWERFQREQAERCRAEDAYLARERADAIARYGWDARAMSWLDQRQADERAQFQNSQQMRENEFRNRMAMMERGHGRGHHERDWD